MTKADRQSTFSGTKEVAAALKFDDARLEAHLTQQVPDFAGPLTVRQFKGGQSNPTYLLETPARRYVLRRKPPGKLLPSAHAVDREYRVIRALHAQGFPVAEPLLYCADESVAGTPFYVMAWTAACSGSRRCRRPNPAERAAVYDAMNATLGAAALVRSRRDRAWRFRPRRELRRAPGRALVEAVPRLADRKDRRHGTADGLAAAQHLPPPAPVRLVHGDYRLDNMILAADAPKVLAVLDWELSTLGDPLADFTYHLMQWHMPASDAGAGTATLVGRDLAALGIPSIGRLRNGCLRGSAPASIRGRICRSISPTISSASPRSCRASSGACATAPRPAKMRRRARRWCARSPNRRSFARQAGAA